MPEVTDPNILAQLNGAGGPIMGPPPKPEKVQRPSPGEGLMWNEEGTAVVPIQGGTKDPASPYYTAPKVAANAGGVLVPVSAASPAQKAVGIYSQLSGAVNSFQDDYGGNLFGGLENTAQSIAGDMVGTPGQRDWWAGFNSVDNTIRNDLFGATLTPSEQAAYAGTSIAPRMDPKIIRENLKRRTDILKGALQRQREFMLANGYKPGAVDAIFAPIIEQQEQLADSAEAATAPALDVQQEADKSTPINQLPGEVQNKDNTALGTGGGSVQNDPVLTGMKSEYASRLAAGQSTGQILKWLTDSGVDVGTPGFVQSVNAQVQFRQKNPQVDISNYNLAAFDDVYVPTGPVRETLNIAAQSPGGTYAINAADAITGFNLDSMTANPELTRRGMEEVGNKNPGSAVLGQVSGGVLSSLVAEAAVPAQGMKAALAGDAIYGTVAGAGQTDYDSDGNPASFGDRAVGAGQGTLAGMVGNLGGKALVKAAQAVTAPTGGSLSGLYEAGVRPSVGQRVANSGDGRGVKGFVGSTINKVEEAAQSVYGVGDAIRGTRETARDQFQIGAFNEALKEIDEVLPAGMKPGTAPQSFTQAAFNRTYDKARSGMQFVADQDFITDVTAVSQTVGQLTESSQKQFKTILDDTLTRRAKAGGMSGDDYKAAMSDLGKKIDSIRRNKNGDDELADALLDLQSTIDNAARRHSPAEFVELMDKADAGYAKLVRIEEASKRAGSDTGQFTPTQFARAVQKGDSSVRSKAYLRGDALMQEYADQGMTLVDKLPNSGTSDRLIVTGGAGAASSFFTPLGAFLGALGIANAPGVRKLTTGAMSPAGPKRQAVGKAIGAFGRPASVLGSTTSVGLIEP